MAAVICFDFWTPEVKHISSNFSAAYTTAMVNPQALFYLISEVIQERVKLEMNVWGVSISVCMKLLWVINKLIVQCLLEGEGN